MLGSGCAPVVDVVAADAGLEVLFAVESVVPLQAKSRDIQPNTTINRLFLMSSFLEGRPNCSI